MQKLKLSLLALSLCVLGVLPVVAQTQPSPATTGAAPAAEPAAAPAAAPAVDAPASDMPPPPPCFPACREGFLCGEGGQCISACNPGCGPGERCAAGGQCVIDSQVTPVGPQYTPPPNAVKPPPPPEEGVETHDGFMLRFTVGIGGGSMTETFDDSALLLDEGTASGGGWMGAVDIGGAITDELTIHGRIGLLELLAPRLEADGEEVDPPYGTSVTAVLIGPGLTYNIMPLNLYITAVGGLNVLTFTYDENDSDFDEDFRDNPTAGFGLNLDVGKEWWVTTQTGIGVAGRFWWGTGGAESDDSLVEVTSDRSLLAFGVVFSVTHQ